MATISTNPVAILLAQALVPLILALLLLHVHSRHRKDYILLWSRSWLALAVFHLLVSAPAVLGWDDFVVWILLPLGMAATFLHLVWLALGSQERARHRPIRLSAARIFTYGAPIAGFAVGLITIIAGADNTVRIQGHWMIYFLGSAVVLAIHAVDLWAQRESKSSSGAEMLSLIFGIWAVFQVAHMILLLGWSRGDPTTITPASMLVAALGLQLLVGVSMITSVLDDELEAVALAAAQIEHYAYHDDLTGLPNRSLFFDRLILVVNRATRRHERAAVVFLDLDDFKKVNDSLGHSFGDSLLRLAADRIRRTIRGEDTAARFGGDEFVFILPDIPNNGAAVRVARKLLDTMREPFPLNGREIVTTASIGIAFFPDDGATAEALVRNADAAMYRAKELGRDNYRIYAPSMGLEVSESLELETALRSALQYNELEIYYQPMFDVVTGDVVALEALLRWNHPTEGVLEPRRFISIAEVSGLIVPIGNWVLHEACRQLKTWTDELQTDLRVSVNLSPRQFIQADLVQQVKSALRKAGIPAQSLDLEITESSAMHDIETTLTILDELKALGVQLSIDDFGTGYSSLNYLKNFPVDTLKLDQSFVGDLHLPHDAAIARGIIEMAHGMNLAVIAEGIENESQLSFLRENSCDTLQGYLFSRPLPVFEATEFLESRRGALREVR